MQKHIKSFVFYVLMFFSTQLSAQEIPVGTWRVHQTYRDAHSVAVAAQKVYCAASNGQFYLDKNETILYTLSKIDGLSDTEVAKLAYSELKNTVVIAYSNGNIDLMRNNNITNIRSVLNSNFIDKVTYHINFIGDLALLSTDFGVVVIDLTRQRIKETYAFIGTSGSSIKVYASAETADSLFLATSEGLRAASLADNISKLDFNNWRTVYTSANIKTVAVHNGKVFFGIDNNGLYQYDNGNATLVAGTENWTLNTLNASAGKLIACRANAVHLLDASLTISTLTNAAYLFSPNEAFYDNQSNLWIADKQAGLVRYDGTNFQNYTPSGTFDKSVFRLKEYNGKIVALSGGFETANFSGAAPSNNLAGFYQFYEGKWTNFTSIPQNIGAQVIPAVADLNDAAFSSITNKLYLASFQQGLLVWDLQTNTFTIDSLQLVRDAAQNKYKVSALAADKQSKIWIANYGVPRGSPSFHSIDRNGQRISYNFTTNIPAVISPKQMIIDNNDNKWVINGVSSFNSRDSIFVFRDANTSRLFSGRTDDGGYDGNIASFNCIALDKNSGAVWIGSSAGIYTISQRTTSSLYNGRVTFERPRYEGIPLLKDENVTAIAVDGGGRKWIGTNNGVWLFDDDGSNTLLQHFTVANSPLLSNKIIDIVIQPYTGEIFFATEKGLVSYRGNATEGTDKYENVKVFPNPVRPDFTGVVSITGLYKDADVKITDITGNLIWQGKAEGSTATWNLYDYNGRKAKTGVYPVFSTATDGSQTYVTKIAVIE